MTANYAGINKTDLINLVIMPALNAIQCEPEAKRNAAAQLLLGTACQESQCGRYLKQVGTGPAIGIFQMEPATHASLWANFITYRPVLAGKLISLRISGMDGAAQMGGNLLYAAAMARVRYFDDPTPLPADGDFVAMAAMWKKTYNSAGGAGTASEFEIGLRALLAG